MKTLKKATLAVVILTFLVINVFAQLPPGLGGGCTNCPPYTNNFTLSPYVPGLKLAILPFGRTNLSLNLLEADPAGKYDIYSASNLVSSPWNDIMQGTNGQMNFSLPYSFTDMEFFRAARTDPSTGDAADMSVYFLSGSVNTNIVQAAVQGGPAAAAAVLVDSTNFAGAVWIPFTSMPLVDIGTNEGVHEVWFGYKGTNGIAYWTMSTITIDKTPPSIVITNPIFSTTAKPIIQIQGYSAEPLFSIFFDVTNAAGIFTNEQAFVTSQLFDTNRFASTTNYFQCFDIPLTSGINTILVHATDMAGNTTTTNVSITQDFSGDTNPPLVLVTWPQDGDSIGGDRLTLRGVLNDETAQIFVLMVDTNGVTNSVDGIVERNGNFWLEDLLLNPGANIVTIIAVNAAGNSFSTNLNLIQSDVVIGIDSVAEGQLLQSTTSVSGTVSDSSYSVWVNDVEATINGSGVWSADNVPVKGSGTACFDVAAYPLNNQSARANSSQSNPSSSVVQSSTQEQPAQVFINQHHDTWDEQSPQGEAHWTFTKSYTAKINGDGNLSFQGNVTDDGVDGGEGYRWWKENYNWSDADITGTNISYRGLVGDSSYNETFSGPGWGDHMSYGNWIPATSLQQLQPFIGISHFFAKIHHIWGNNESIYSRNSETFMQVRTGGKSGIKRKALFRFNATGTEYGKPSGIGWHNAPDLWLNTPMTNIVPTRIRILGKNVGSDGNFYTVLPDNATLDLGISAPGSHHSMNVSVQKHKLHILANNYPLADDRVRPQAYYCVGQKINFQAVFSPEISDLNYTSPTWNYTADYVNNHYTDSHGCEIYNIAPIPAMSNPTTAWFYNKHTKDVTANLGFYCKFNNGQSAYLVRQGKLNVFTPSIEVVAGRAPGPPAIHIDRYWYQPMLRIGLTDTNNSSNTYDLMAFHGFVSSISKFPGEVMATQLVNRDASIDGIPFDSTGGSYCLDGGEIYPDTHDEVSETTTPNQTFGDIDYADGPGIGIQYASWASINDHFKTYCRFRPSGTDSIYVTLKRVDWDWHATVDYTGFNPFELSSWTITSSEINGPTPVDVNEFPQWDCSE